MNAVYPHHYGLHLFEYLLIIEPSNLVQKQLRAFKQYFIKSYRYPNAIVSKSHMTLMRFIQYDSYENHMVREFQRIADMAMPFDVELHGFGSFGHTLFVDVKSEVPILQLIATHRRTLRPLVSGVKGHAARFVTKPHITIARKLTPPQNAMVWPIWNRTAYHGEFRARNMTLLRRRVGTHTYSTVHKFEFLGLSPAFTQGKLFA
ncbi:2'-5' RNA ligase family protein [Parapedobacter sp. 10938]|uniref:2'-5' RNA ligase family protein n=1 Tax=Parapedobacter flavus TaxID=3110225 RepID=UPI002DBF4D94|nr:2'-5' RNA ligase family protein [Parapedobacter sp. 10938]MEC3878559.1 2'-5' RNA ligase family protein [Parapedobacter sp. 10938]